MDKVQDGLVSPQIQDKADNKTEKSRQAARLGAAPGIQLALAIVPYLFTIAYLLASIARQTNLGPVYTIVAFALNIGSTILFSLNRVSPLLNYYALKTLSRRWVSYRKAWKVSLQVNGMTFFLCLISLLMLEQAGASEGVALGVVYFVPTIVALAALLSRFGTINKLQLWVEHSAIIGLSILSYADLESVVRVPWQGVDLRLRGNARPLECHLNDRDADHLLSAIKPLLIPYGVRFNS